MDPAHRSFECPKYWSNSFFRGIEFDQSVGHSNERCAGSARIWSSASYNSPIMCSSASIGRSRSRVVLTALCVALSLVCVSAPDPATGLAKGGGKHAEVVPHACAIVGQPTLKPHIPRRGSRRSAEGETFIGGRERGREEEKERGREGERERGREGERERGREGERLLPTFRRRGSRLHRADPPNTLTLTTARYRRGPSQNKRAV